METDALLLINEQAPPYTALKVDTPPPHYNYTFCLWYKLQQLCGLITHNIMASFVTLSTLITIAVLSAYRINSSRPYECNCISTPENVSMPGYYCNTSDATIQFLLNNCTDNATFIICSITDYGPPPYTCWNYTVVALFYFCIAFFAASFVMCCFIYKYRPPF